MRAETKFRINKIFKHLHWITPLLVLIIYFVWLMIDYFTRRQMPQFEAIEISVIVGMAGTLAGFFVTIWILVFALPKDNEKITLFRKTGHLNIFSKCNFFGLLFCLINICTYLFFSIKWLNVLFLLLALAEILNDTYYVYNMIKIFFNPDKES